MSNNNRILVKLRSSNALAAADSRANLRPLYDTPAASAGLGIASGPQWYLADLPDGANIPWDSAHARVADQLGVAASDVLFAEPDLAHTIYRDPNEVAGDMPFAVGENCGPQGQTADGGRIKGPPNVFAWHLGDDYSQLGTARAAVEFSDRRTRIAHIDTGYDKKHVSKPEHILTELERNFVDSDGNPNDAQDPDNKVFLLDNSGHGTGTSGILAGGKAVDFDDFVIGGAPGAAVVPLRIADSVVLFRTSAFAQALRYATQQGCDVVTISMGGLPSRAWNEAVNEAYEAGVCIVAAAGNNVSGAPTHHVVYPARYHRVIAACGVMADGTPYINLKGKTMEGNWGPDSSMTTALATYTPNIPWPMFACGSAVRENGEGTSAATPQIAAAAALWYEKYKNVLPRDWRRVEAVRKALFDSAKNKTADPKHLGRGILQAAAALAIKPVLNLEKTKADSDSFAFLRVITGLGVVDVPPREEMFNLELTQRWLLNEELQKIVPDLNASGLEVPKADKQKFMEAIIEDKDTSLALRRHIASRYPLVSGARALKAPKEVVPAVPRVCEKEPSLADPPFRRVRAYASDPSFSTRLETASINEVVLKIRWEELEPGPTGEYLQVIDEDATGTSYTPVDLDDARLLAQDGWAPSEGNPAFHQQMVYAVAMKTIEHFEQALGRPVLWRPRNNPENRFDDSQFVRRLLVRPHALRQANAFYSPQEVGLLFGYFETSSAQPGESVPGSRVYACLSHDIVAHETTHAILDGIHRRFNEPTNLDVLALHEAFADIVALMQHFTIPEVLEREISRTRGDLEGESTLGSLAVQFGQATGGRAALRDAIGSIDEKGVWTRIKPDPAELQKRVVPHSRGAILVAAVFDAFIAIYKSRTVDLLRIYTGGTGVLPSGAIHPDLVHRLADEAATSAKHVLNMCIRALDYIPPVDITFGEYLRGIITADFDLVGDDRYNYRVAFVEAFRGRGIYPHDLDTLSVDTLRWQGLDLSSLSKKDRAAMNQQYDDIVERLKRYNDACLYINDREELFKVTRAQRGALHRALKKAFAATPKFAEGLGINPKTSDSTVEDFEVHSLRRSLKTGAGGQQIPQVVVELTQSREIEVQGQPHTFRGGSTLVVDLSKPEVKYRINKDINSKPSRDGTSRLDRTVAFWRGVSEDPLRKLLFASDRAEPFAALHTLADESSF
jgi:subtilisin family serine protease